MRHILVAALAAAALVACTSDVMMQAAIRECEYNGITRADPQFDTCTQAFRLSANQANLETTYHRALNPTYDNGKIAHQWHGY
jgi:hypothetical protein